MAVNANIDGPLFTDLPTVVSNKNQCYKEFHRLKPNTSHYRKLFLYHQCREVISHNNKLKVSEIKCIIKKEHAR